MTERPAIGSRVRTLGNLGIPAWCRRTAVVVAHHVDGIAFRIRFEDSNEYIVCDPVNVQLAAGDGERATK